MKTNMDDQSVAELHRAEYDSRPEFIVSAPGSVRVLGEHTLFNNGMLIAFPLDRRIFFAISSRKDNSIRFYATNYNERKRTNLSSLKYKREDRWANYIKASISAFSNEGGKGYNITVSGDIPQNLGLGSAVALQCSSAKAVSLMTGLNLGPLELAQAIVQSDSNYFEKLSDTSIYLPTLAMAENKLIFVDAKKKTYELLASSLMNTKLILTDSKVPRLPIEAELIQRINDCNLGLSMMSGNNQKSFRDYSTEEIDEFMGQIPERIRRHCLFMVEELIRVEEAKEALLHKDIGLFSKILNKSQTGLRNTYEISCPEIDWLVKRATEINGIRACRMIGRGFGGCTLSLAKEEAMEEYKNRLDEYERIFGFKPGILEISIGTGMIVS